LCTPTACGAPNGDHYCAHSATSAGGHSHCGTTCPKAGCVCNHNMCKGDSTCLLLDLCGTSGTITVGPLGTAVAGRLDCGSHLPQARLGVRRRSVQGGPISAVWREPAPRPRETNTAEPIADGCGNSLDCAAPAPRPAGSARTTCARAGPTAGCVPLACTTANGDQYCGTIGDGCGNSVDCGTTCHEARMEPAKTTCAKPRRRLTACHWLARPLTATVLRNHRRRLWQSVGLWQHLQQGRVDLRRTTCAKEPQECARHYCNPASGGQYCGTIGDAAATRWAAAPTVGCGQRLGVRQQDVCVGGAGCVKLTCNNTVPAQQYCGDAATAAAGR